MYEVIGVLDWLEGLWYIFTEGVWGVCDDVLRSVYQLQHNYRRCKCLPS